MRLSVKLLWLVATTFLSSNVNGQIDWVAIDSRIAAYTQRHQTPGLVLSFVNTTGGPPQLAAKGYGVMNMEDNIPMSNRTRVLIASVSKSFTATVATRFLANRFPNLGKYVLDTPIITLAPRFNFVLPDRYRTEHVTMRDLLSHRVCVKSNGMGGPVGAYKTREELIFRTRYLTEACGFRTRQEYSNFMFLLAGAVISNISTVPFETMLYELLTELEMQDTLLINETDDYETLPMLSRGYYLGLDGTLKKLNLSIFANPYGPEAGGIISTSQDMTKYIAFQLSKGKNVAGQQVVPESVMEWQYELSNIFPFYGPKDPQNPARYLSGIFGYGLGWNLAIYGDGYLQYNHKGDSAPFISQLTLYPSLNFGIFTSANGPGNNLPEEDQLRLHNELMDILLGKSLKQSDFNSVVTKPTANEQLTADTNIHSITLRDEIDPELLTGTFGNPWDGDINISWNGSNLVMQYGVWGSGYLEKEEATENLYKLHWQGEIVGVLLASVGGPPLPEFNIYFDDMDTLAYSFAGNLANAVRYKRNATIDTYPEIPWDEGSCH